MRRTPLPPIHPGEILREEFVAPMGLSASKLAQALDVPTNRVTQIMNGKREISADTALRLARAFGTTSEFWLNLQKLYELEMAEMKVGKEIENTVSLIKLRARDRELACA
jgi:addiction module HigA family antidote